MAKSNPMNPLSEKEQSERAAALIGAFRMGLQPFISGEDSVPQLEEWLSFSHDWLVLSEEPDLQEMEEEEMESAVEDSNALMIHELRGSDGSRGWFYGVENGLGQHALWIDGAGPFLDIDSLRESCRAHMENWHHWDIFTEDLNEEQQAFCDSLQK